MYGALFFTRFNWVYVFIFIVFLFGNFGGPFGLAFILFYLAVAFLISLTFWAPYKFMAQPESAVVNGLDWGFRFGLGVQ